MRSLLVCCLFGALLATGTSLECENCMGLGKRCEGYMKPCAEDEDTCIHSVFELLQDSVTITMNGKECGKLSSCEYEQPEVDVGKGLRMRVHRSCCTGEKCRTLPPPELSPLDLKSNNLQCPGCMGIFSDKCHEQPVECTGSNTKCISIVVNATAPEHPQFAIKGCASEDICTLLKPDSYGFFTTPVWFKEFRCTEPAHIEAA